MKIVSGGGEREMGLKKNVVDDHGKSLFHFKNATFHPRMDTTVLYLLNAIS